MRSKQKNITSAALFIFIDYHY